MAKYSDTLQIKIQDLELFSRLVTAIGEWATEMRERGNLTRAEAELLNAAVELEEKGTSDNGDKT